MKIKHTKKVTGFAYKPDDKTEPALGTIVEVSDALGVALICRGWGEDVSGGIVVQRHEPGAEVDAEPASIQSIIEDKE